jgi:hypothetical protein
MVNKFWSPDRLYVTDNSLLIVEHALSHFKLFN